MLFLVDSVDLHSHVYQGHVIGSHVIAPVPME